MFVVFFFKQKTAYELLISYLISDVCSSDLLISMDLKLESSSVDFVPLEIHRRFLEIAAGRDVYAKIVITPDTRDDEVLDAARTVEIGRASCRGRVCKDV